MGVFVEKEKKMKKVLLILLIMALVLSMAGTVAGKLVTETTTISDEPTGTTVDSVLVSYTISEEYTVKIPTHFEFTASSSGVTAGALISVDIDRIGEGEYVWVNVTSSQYTDHWNLKSDNSNDQDRYRYHMGVTESSNDHPDFGTNNHDSVCIENGGEVMNVPDTELDEVNRYIHLKLVDVPEGAATYTDSLTFTINVGPYS